MSFAADLQRFNGRTEKRFELAVKKLSFDIARKIIKRTPVDTGMAKRNWHVELNDQKTFVRDDTDKTGERTIAEAGAVINKARIGDSIYITNNLPYIERLENGWSDQAPQGMVGITVVEFKSTVDAIVRSFK